MPHSADLLPSPAPACGGGRKPPAVSHLGVIAAAVSPFVLGRFWHGPLFGAGRVAENGFREADVKRGNHGKIYGLASLWTLVMAYNLAFLLGDTSIRFSQGLMYGFLTVFGRITMGAL